MAHLASDNTGTTLQEREHSVDCYVTAPEEQILDRVYDFPDALPEKVMDMLVDLTTDDSVTNRELEFIYFQIITLPLMAKSGMFADQKDRFLSENKCSFQDYIRYRLNRLSYMGRSGCDPNFCERIRQLLWRFTVV